MTDIENNTDTQIPGWGDKELLKGILNLTTAELVTPVAYRGDEKKQFQRATRDIHLMMRENYAQMIYQVGRNIFPLIIASDNEPQYEGVGTSYTLYLADGSSKRIVPTCAEYEVYKNLSHMPLGLFTIISSYFDSPTAKGWMNDMKAFEVKVNEALHALQDSGYDDTIFTLCGNMLSEVSSYIAECLRKQSVDLESYLTFTRSMFPMIEASMSKAAQLQVNAAYPQLKKWKEELGELWQDVYVLVPTVWPVAGRNPRQQIFELLMEPEKAKTNIIMTEGAKNVEEALTTLGRVVADRAVGRFVFGTHCAASTSMVCALSTPRDVVSDACEQAIDELEKS